MDIGKYARPGQCAIICSCAHRSPISTHVRQLAKAKPALFSMVTQPEDDDEERFVDADGRLCVYVRAAKERVVHLDTAWACCGIGRSVFSVSALVRCLCVYAQWLCALLTFGGGACADSEEGEGKQQADGKSREDESGGGNGQGWNTSFGRYDPLKREPLHSGAELSCAWELTQVRALPVCMVGGLLAVCNKCAPDVMLDHGLLALVNADEIPRLLAYTSARARAAGVALPPVCGQVRVHAALRTAYHVRWRPSPGLHPDALPGQVCLQEPQEAARAEGRVAHAEGHLRRCEHSREHGGVPGDAQGLLRV